MATKDFRTCGKCKYDFFLCCDNKMCVNCQQDDKGKCKCNAIQYGEECPFFEERTKEDDT